MWLLGRVWCGFGPRRRGLLYDLISFLRLGRWGWDEECDVGVMIMGVGDIYMR